MKKYGEDYRLDQNEMDIIASYMDDEIRKGLHFELAPCEPEEFLIAYLERDPDFESLLESEFMTSTIKGRKALFAGSENVRIDQN